MTDIPVGAIIPPRIGDVELTLFDGWYLMLGSDARALDEGWECCPLPSMHRPFWDSGVHWGTYSWIIARRARKEVTVECGPNDRIVVLNDKAWIALHDYIADVLPSFTNGLSAAPYAPADINSAFRALDIAERAV